MPTPFDLVGLDHVVLRIRALEPALAFYRDVLGCELARARDDLGLYHLRAGRTMIDLVPLDGELGRKGGAGPGAEARNMDHLCLRIEPFDAAALLAHFGAHGIDASEPAQRFGAEGDGPSVYITDPDGNTVELKGPPIG